MPTYVGTLSLDHPSGTTIEKAGVALLAEHTPAIEHYQHHNGTTIEASGLAAFEKNEEALDKAEAVMIAKHSIPDVFVPVKTTKKIVTDQAVVLENAAHGFKKPNIMDVKLGVRLWADDAKEEKRIRFNKVTDISLVNTSSRFNGRLYPLLSIDKNSSSERLNNLKR
jgi:1D-myo-inositol-tetrakisphosphate 5-kinase/inositol-polyphosphate multikinase